MYVEIVQEILVVKYYFRCVTQWRGDTFRKWTEWEEVWNRVEHGSVKFAESSGHMTQNGGRAWFKYPGE